jgi:hypothetical protein
VAITHELAHLYCGHIGTVDTRWWPDRQGLPEDVAEFEAESTAYVVCSQIGLKLPSESYLYRYLRDNDEIPDISFECVMKAAGIIESMGKKRLGPDPFGRAIIRYMPSPIICDIINIQR